MTDTSLSLTLPSIRVGTNAKLLTTYAILQKYYSGSSLFSVKMFQFSNK